MHMNSKYLPVTVSFSPFSQNMLLSGHHQCVLCRCFSALRHRDGGGWVLSSGMVLHFMQELRMFAVKAAMGFRTLIPSSKLGCAIRNIIEAFPVTPGAPTSRLPPNDWWADSVGGVGSQ